MILFLLVFLSSGFVATATMPAGLRQFAEYQPFTPLADTAHGGDLLEWFVRAGEGLVVNDFTILRDSEVAAVVDGGDCDGRQSSVVDCARRRPTCVREGAISWSEIEALLGR